MLLQKIAVSKEANNLIDLLETPIQIIIQPIKM